MTDAFAACSLQDNEDIARQIRGTAEADTEKEVQIDQAEGLVAEADGPAGRRSSAVSVSRCGGLTHPANEIVSRWYVKILYL